MTTGYQLDAQGRRRIDAQGRLIVAPSTALCCCSGTPGTFDCDCAVRQYGTCPGDLLTEENSGVEYDTRVVASGTCYSVVSAPLWRFATESDEGLFWDLYGYAELPDPPPTDGVLVDITWSIDVVVAVRCPGTSRARTATSSGSYSYAGTWYRKDPDTGVWGMATASASNSWIGYDLSATANASSCPWFGDLAQSTRTKLLNLGVPGALWAFLDSVNGAYPPLTGPISACVETYPAGSLAGFGTDRVPLPGLDVEPPDPAARLFVPSYYSAYAYSGTSGAANTDVASSQEASFTWTWLAARGFGSPGDPITAGSATQTYEWRTNTDVVTPCDPEGGL